MNKYDIKYHQIGGRNRFNQGDKFRNTNTGKIGTVLTLRSDRHEQQTSWTMSPPRYHYHVDYDDGSFETYESEMFMERISQAYNHHTFNNSVIDLNAPGQYDTRFVVSIGQKVVITLGDNYTRPIMTNRGCQKNMHHGFIYKIFNDNEMQIKLNTGHIVLYDKRWLCIEPIMDEYSHNPYSSSPEPYLPVVPSKPVIPSKQYRCVYRDPTCIGDRDVITLEDINNINNVVKVDKKCYDADELQKWLVNNSNLPHNRQTYSSKELNECVEGTNNKFNLSPSSPTISSNMYSHTIFPNQIVQSPRYYKYNYVDDEDDDSDSDDDYMKNDSEFISSYKKKTSKKKTSKKKTSKKKTSKKKTSKKKTSKKKTSKKKTSKKKTSKKKTSKKEI